MNLSNPCQIALIGCGKIADAHLSVFKQFPEKVRLTAVCSATRQSGVQRAKEMGLDADRVYTDYHLLLQRTDVDAVIITLPHYLHFPAASAALLAGKHVLLEKPFANTWKECISLVQIAQKTNRILQIGQVLRFLNPHHAVQKRISSGEFGTVRMVRSEINQNLSHYMKPPHWLYERSKAGGGVLMGVGVHRIDLLRYWLGEIAEIHAYGQTANPDFIDAEDYVTCNFKFCSGSLGVLTMTYSEFVRASADHWVIYGDRGVLHNLTPYHGEKSLWVCSQKTKEQEDGFIPLKAEGPYPTEDPFINQTLHFVDSIETGKAPLSSGRDNLRTMAVIFGGYESMKIKSSVSIEEWLSKADLQH